MESDEKQVEPDKKQKRRGAGRGQLARALLVLFLGYAHSACQPARDYGDSTLLPNFILILADDQGWSQLSGGMDPKLPESASTYLETPRLERLAKLGMRFTDAYAPAPFCTPTRRSILCGTSSPRSGPEFHGSWVPAEHLTIPKALKKVHPDYQTAHFGMWGNFIGSSPEEAGYDISDGPTDNHPGGTAKSHGLSADHFKGPPYFIDEEDGKRSRSITNRGIAFMREQTRVQKPFYMQLSYYALHLSVECKQATLDKYEAKGNPDRGYTTSFAAMLEELDAQVGRVLDAVEQEGIAGKTYVIYTSDNGGRDPIPGGTDVPTNLPLRGAKHVLYEGGLRVPMLVWGPGIEAGSVCRTPVVGYDFLPTFYDFAGGQMALPDEIDGVSLRPLFAEPQLELEARREGALFFHRPKRLQSAIRRGNYKLMLHWTEAGKLESRELYDLSSDPFELNDLIQTDSLRAGELEQILLDHLSDVDSPMVESFFVQKG